MSMCLLILFYPYSHTYILTCTHILMLTHIHTYIYRTNPYKVYLYTIYKYTVITTAKHTYLTVIILIKYYHNFMHVGSMRYILLY